MTRELFEEYDLTVDELNKENQALKKQVENYKKLGFKHLQDQNVELNKKYVNAVADYETTMAEKEQLNHLVNSCQEEIRQLKKQLEEYETYLNRFFKINNKSYDGKIVLGLLDKKEAQQKEFIKYLEDESKEIYRDGGLRQNIFKQVLQKCKEIIGVSDEIN